MGKTLTFAFTGFVLGLAVYVSPLSVMAQLCDPTVPVHIVDLTGNPDSIWFQPNIIRDGSCCGYAHPPNSCVQFILTLDEEAEGIIFDVTCGALPTNLEWQLMDQAGVCDTTLYPAGVPVCLNGVGPHTVIFCKPGGNDNCYEITSIPKAGVSPAVVVNDGCTDTLAVSGLIDTTIVWQSVDPGNPGDYDGYLDCTQDCDTVKVTAQPGFPPYVDFEVCGTIFGGCATDTQYCDTVRAYFNTTLLVDIMPEFPAICYGSSGTTISAQGTGGTAPYSYVWNTGETTDSIFVTDTGTYFVQMGDTSGCPPVYDTVTVIQFFSEIEAIAGPDQVVCKQDLPVSLSGTVIAAPGGTWSGGSGTFSPSADSLNTSYSPSSSEILAGFVQLYLTTTGNGSCPADTDTIVITIPDFTASVSIDTTAVSCFNGSDGTANVTLSGSSAPYSFSWNTPNPQSGNTATGLQAGSYDLTITNGLGCDSIFFFTITEPVAITLTIDSTSSFCGDANGSSTVTASGGVTPYSYYWNNGQTSATATGLSSGMYYVTVTDNNSCTADTSTIVNNVEPEISITDTTHVTCPGGSDGSAIVTATSGLAPYIYIWGSGSTDSTATGLSAGNIYVTVTDDNGCQGITFVEITAPPGYILTTDSTEVSCNGGNNGTASVSISGGTPPYSYQWDINTGYQTFSTAYGLSAGTYYITITDDADCTVDTAVVVTEPPLFTATDSVTDISCYGGNDGSATINASGGKTPYSYQWSATAGSQTTSTATGLGAGTFGITITDANNCVLIQSVSVTEPAALGLTTNVTHVTCSGGSDGIITANASGGTTPYSYEWSANANNQTSAQATGLSAGIYTVTVTDNSSCTISGMDTVNVPDPVVVALTGDDTVCVNAPANLTATASGGDGPYTYNWSEAGAVGPSIQVFPATTTLYSVTATDNSGCQSAPASHTVYIRNIFQDSIIATSGGSVCVGQSSTVSGYFNGTLGPYTFNWSHGLGNGPGPHIVTANDTVIYEYTATDVCGNSVSDTTLVLAYAYPVVNTSPDSVEGCVPFTVSFSNNNSSNATIASYYWEFGDGFSSNLPNPTHTYKEDGYYQVYLMVVSENGCTTAVSGSSYISVFPAPEAGFTANPEQTDIRTPTISFTSSSFGAQDHDWSFGDGSVSTEEHPVYVYGDTGTYQVTLAVVNEYGCTDTLKKTVIIDPYYSIIVPNAFTPDQSGPNGGWYDVFSLDNTIFYPITEYVVDFHMMIYNRWGELIFESFDIKQGWDGYYRGQLSQQDVYVWKVKVRFADGSEVTKVGDVTLLR